MSFEKNYADNIEHTDSSNSIEWSCRCFICRTIVYPILRVLHGKEEVRQEVGLEVVEPIETEVKEKEVTTGGQPLDLKSVEEAIVNSVSALIDTKLKNFESRITKMEEEMQKLKNELDSSIEEIRSALVDVRASISDILNPFNVLRTYVGVEKGRAPSFEEIEKAISAIEKKVRSEAREHEYGKKATSVERPEERGKMIEEAQVSGRLELGNVIRLMKYVDNLVMKYPREVVEGLIRFLADVGVITGSEAKTVLDIVEFIYSARKIGVKSRDIVLTIYSLAKIMGIEDPSADKEIAGIATNGETDGV